MKNFDIAECVGSFHDDIRSEALAIDAMREEIFVQKICGEISATCKLINGIRWLSSEESIHQAHPTHIVWFPSINGISQGKTYRVLHRCKKHGRTTRLVECLFVILEL